MREYTYKDLARTIASLLEGDRTGFAGNNIDEIRSYQDLLDHLSRVKKSYEESRGFLPAHVPYLVHFATIRSDLNESEVIGILDLYEIEHRVAWYEEATQQDLYSFDGNTVRKLSGSSSQARKSQEKATREFPVEIWLSGKFTLSDQRDIHDALKALLKDVDLLPLSSEQPEIGSFFQRLKFVGRIGAYSKKLIANLKTAFGAMATAQKIESISKLSKILEKSSHAVLRVDDVIAVKTTRNRQTYTVVVAIPQFVERQLQADPGLIRDAERLYDLLTSGHGTIKQVAGTGARAPASSAPTGDA